MIKPQVLKGFRDFLPEYELERKRISHLLQHVFEGNGYVPIDTPILEYTEVLLGKGGGETDKQIYRFEDHGKRDVAMRFDLTVPFARFMAAHVNELYLPFKRYHIEKVWRGENTQRGRYREFTQCDFDIVGVDTVSADFEILSIIIQSFHAMGIDKIKVHLSHREVFNHFAAKENISEQANSILRIIDKLRKIGEERVKSELSEFLEADKIEKIMQYIKTEKDFSTTLDKLEKLAGNCEPIERLKELELLIKSLQYEDRVVLDPSITRGLDYYTGLVYETFLEDLPDIGAVCSGGRYNNLAGLYTKQELPGIGAAIGLDRLFAALEELQLMKKSNSTTDLIIMHMDGELLPKYHEFAQKFRDNGIAVEVYPQNKKLKQQFSFTEKKNIPFALFLGDEELSQNSVTLKNLISRDSYDKISFEKAVEIIKQGN